MAQSTQYPFGNHKLVSGILRVGGKKLYLILLIFQSIDIKIPDFGMPVLYQASNGGNRCHSFRTKFLKFCEGGSLVVSPLIIGYV